MANFDKILEDINDNVNREVNLFNLELESVLKTVQELVSIKAVELYDSPLEFDFAVQQILQEAGYYDLVNDFIDDSYDKSYGEIIALFEAGGLTATFTADDITSIKAIKQLDLDFFDDIGKQASSRLKADLYKYQISDLDTKTMVENIRDSLKDTNLVKYSSTYADTAISNFNQSMIDLKSADVIDEVYIYRGVKDKKTRDFCRCLISQRKYYDKSDAGKIKNDKKRQYNCRHLIIAVSLDYALSRGYKKGSFSC